MDHQLQQTTTDHQKYNVISILTSIDDEDSDAEVNVLRYGKHFIIHILPSDFRNSPAATAEYLAYLKVLKSCEEELDDVYESDFYDWAMLPFEPVFEEFAPAPAQIPKVTLQDSLFPEFFVFRLAAIDDKLVPQCIETQDSGQMPPGALLFPEALHRLNKWATPYRPSEEVEVVFAKPEDALFRPPKKVLVDGGRTICFFKAIFPGDIFKAEIELEAYEKICRANLRSDVRICRLHGVVQSEEGLVCGLLLTHIEGAKPLCNVLWPGVPISLRERSARRMKETLSELHQAGLVWGDAKDENVLIDKENDAWITDCGGGYARG